MSTKTANVVARVHPEVKEEAELIMEQIGVSASTVVNMLYRQIIWTKSIPFDLKVPFAPKARDEMPISTFNSIMENGLREAKADSSRPYQDVFQDLRRNL